MRLMIAGAALVLLVAAGPVAAAPSVRGAATIGLGMRGNQGDVTPGGFRFLMIAGLSIDKLAIIFELDRGIGPDVRVTDGDGDAAHWYEWVAAIRTGRRNALVRGLSLVTTGGVSLVHATITGPLDGSRPRLEVNRSNLGLEAGASLMWQSEALLVTVGGGLTVIPFAQEIRSGELYFELPARIEPSGSLGIGFLF